MQVPDLAVVPGINASAVLWEVSVTMNCQHYFTSGLVYNLYNQPYLAAAAPSGSPIGVNSTVLLHGRGFAIHVESLKMRFGDKLQSKLEIILNSDVYTAMKVSRYVFATTSICILLSDVLIRCPLPFNVTSAILPLQVTLNDVDYNPTTEIQYQCYEC